MYARLWWKDARQFWPIWLLVFLAAGVTQSLMLIFMGRQVQGGALFFPALFWSGLYALAAGAAAFAAERETGTLRLLDILPADRRLVWAGKVSFAIVSTVGLTALLLLMAAAGTRMRNLEIGPTRLSAAIACMFVLLALGWGLFWSSIVKSSLTAALAAMCCTGLLLGYYSQYRVREEFGLAEFVVFIATVAASDLVFTSSTRRSRMPFQLQSPIVRRPSVSPRAGRIGAQSPFRAVPRRPIAPVRQPHAATPPAPGRRSLLIQAWALFRETVKEGWRTWAMLTTILIVLAASSHVYRDYVYGGLYDNTAWLFIGALAISSAAGASVFGLENRARTQRFLVHHGARPGIVWLVKVVTWGLGPAVLVFAAASFVWYMQARFWYTQPRFRGSGEDVTLALACLPLAFAVGVICGMAFRRGITAFVIAVVATAALAMPLISLAVENVVPVAGILMVAAALLVISWAWRHDWMLERPAPGRWLRLGLYLAVAIPVLSACHIGFRVWSVPNVGPIAPPESWAEFSSIEMSPDRNAAELYQEAGRRLTYLGKPSDDTPIMFLNRNKYSLDLIRRAAARPDCRFERLGRPTLLDESARPSLLAFSRLLSAEASVRLSSGDLAGSWEDVMVLFRMARHFAEGSGVDGARFALVFAEREALIIALDWATAPGQTRERLRAALEAYRNLPKMPPASDVVRAEANLVENTLSLPVDRLRHYLEEMLFGPPSSGEADHAQRLLRFGIVDVVTTPWELARARRVYRAISVAALKSASREPGHRNDGGSRDHGFYDQSRDLPGPLQSLSQPPEAYLGTDDQNEVARRALEQVIAIRIWQLEHEGRFPDRLEALVPDELKSLPLDPYSDGPFRYVRAAVDGILPLQDALSVSLAFNRSQLITPPPGSRLLYSVGHDRQDDGGTSDSLTFPGRDLVFLIPPVEKSAGGGNDKADSTPKAKTEPARPK